MDDMFDILEPDHRPITSECSSSAISSPPPAPSPDDENGDDNSDKTVDSDFYSDEEAPPNKVAEQKIIYLCGRGEVRVMKERGL